ncbi:MAG: cyanophycinase [Acidobacteria bacterium]|nr:cyanophycinase [Acidobacteriota bacterium]
MLRELNTLILMLAFASATPASFLPPVLAQTARGAIVAVGGGGTTPDIVGKTLALAGGKEAIVAVLPQSSALPDAGDSSVQMWLDAGAKSAGKVLFDDPAKARAALEGATLIWMPGGDQNRFMKAIDGTGLSEVIHARYRASAVVGGTSAGAAILSDAMITGEADLKSLTAGKTILGKGLGLLTNVIVDQHFLQRQRSNRLISAVLDRPTMIGIGIDEATAVIFRGTSFEVVGKSSVVVVDPREATREVVADGQVVAGTNLKPAVLRQGMTYPLK